MTFSSVKCKCFIPERCSGQCLARDTHPSVTLANKPAAGLPLFHRRPSHSQQRFLLPGRLQSSLHKTKQDALVGEENWHLWSENWVHFGPCPGEVVDSRTEADLEGQVAVQERVCDCKNGRWGELNRGKRRPGAAAAEASSTLHSTPLPSSCHRDCSSGLCLET